MSTTMRRVWWVGLIAGLLVLTGCAGGLQTKPVNQYSGLYSGKSELTFSTLMPVESAEEGIARGDSAYAEGKLDLAVFEYIRSLELDPDNADTFYKIGAINLHKQALKKSESAFRLSLERNHEHAGSLEGLGLILLQQRDYEQAWTMFGLATKYDLNRWKSFNALGILADLRGDFIKARYHYDAALRLSPRNAQVRSNLGYSYYLAGDWDKAESEYHAALNADPGHERAWRNLGQLQTRRGRYDEALDVFTHAMDEADAYNTMGYICMSDGKYECAEKYFKKAARTSPSYHVTANENLAQVRRLKKQDKRRQ